MDQVADLQTGRESDFKGQSDPNVKTDYLGDVGPTGEGLVVQMLKEVHQSSREQAEDLQWGIRYLKKEV